VLPVYQGEAIALARDVVIGEQGPDGILDPLAPLDHEERQLVTEHFLRNLEDRVIFEIKR
jgi:hypothetical protein